LPEILIQNVRVPELLCGANILPKSSSLYLGATTLQKIDGQTDRRQTDGSCDKPNVTL